jgi:hypothetical protein
MPEIRQHEFEGSLSITFDCDTPCDSAIEASGHEPNGYFWEGIAQVLISTEAPDLAGKVNLDCEGSMFCAVSDSSEPLESLSALLTPVVNDPDRVIALIEKAAKIGFEFDD